MSLALSKAFDELVHDERSANNAKLPDCDKMAMGFGVEACFHPFDGYKCTKPKGHTGEHIAHGAFAQVIARWP